jgi:hypothetical protein
VPASAAKLTEMEAQYDKQFKVVFEVLNELMAPPEPKRKEIGFHVKEDRAKYTTKKRTSKTPFFLEYLLSGGMPSIAGFLSRCRE